MALKFRNSTSDEIVLLHDFYFLSSEPDAPKTKFDNLSLEDRASVSVQFPIESYQSATEGKELLGFAGFFPDDDLNVNIFYAISPDHKGKGHFKEILKLSIDYCEKHFSEYKNIRALTRKQNLASIKGLERGCFVRQGQVIQEVRPDVHVHYEEYIFPIGRDL